MSPDRTEESQPACATFESGVYQTGRNEIVTPSVKKVEETAGCGRHPARSYYLDGDVLPPRDCNV